MEQKKFMDISRIKEDTEFTESNTKGFEVGDHIVIQEKIDGSNAAIAYDVETDKLVAFSRKKELNETNTLNGFYNWVQTLDSNLFKEYPNYVFFGEWLCKHKVKYVQDAYKKFYFYDAYDKKNQRYLLQTEVRRLADELGLIYVNTFYNGRFISWEHCKLFMNNSNIAIDKQEGIVCKNQTKINNPNSRMPFVLKIVNKDFAETMKKKEKVLDPEVEAAKLKAKEIVDQIVTRNRVEKMIYKLRDEGVLPTKLNPEDMGMIARILPKEIYEDCIKEEKEMVIAAGEYFGKMCSSITMLHARCIILGEM